MATLGGCAALKPGQSPSLPRIYGNYGFGNYGDAVHGSGREPGPPLIFVPGAFGTTLEDGHRER